MGLQEYRRMEEWKEESSDAPNIRDGRWALRARASIALDDALTYGRSSRTLVPKQLPDVERHENKTPSGESPGLRGGARSLGQWSERRGRRPGSAGREEARRSPRGSPGG